MLTKLRVSKVTLLLVITLGIYGLIWLAMRRNEIVERYKIQLPPWWLVVLPIAALLPAVFVATYVSVALLPLRAGIITATFIDLVIFSVACGVSFWWMQRFASAVEQITAGKMPVRWTMLYWTFTMVGVIIVLQHFFNSLPNKKYKSRARQPSRQFIVLSVLSFAITTLVSTAFFIGVLFLTTDTPTESESAEITKLSKQADLLSKKYNYCTSQLDEKYPSVSPEQEAEYGKGYDACENIRLEQNAAAEKATNLIQSTSGWILW